MREGLGIYRIVLVIILFACIGCNFFWIYHDHSPPIWDEAKHLSLSFKLFQGDKKISSVLGLSHIFPPLYYISSLPLFYLFGFSQDTAVCVNLAYFFLLGISVFAIGSQLFHARVGLLSACLVMLYPMVYGLSRLYMLDFALVALVACAQAVILRGMGAQKNLFALVVGCVVGCALLIKPNAGIFLLPTFIMLVYAQIRRRSWMFIVLAITIGLLIVLPWYRSALGGLLASNKFNLNAVKTSHVFFSDQLSYSSPGTFLESFSHFWFGIWHLVISRPLGQAFLLGVILLCILRRNLKVFIFLGLWFLVPSLGFMMWPVKDFRYIVPIVPVLALCTVAGIDALPQRYIKNILLSIVFGCALVQFSYLTFGSPSLPYGRQDVFSHAPMRDDWKIRDMVDDLCTVVSVDASSRIISLAAHKYINASTVEYYMLIRGRLVHAQVYDFAKGYVFQPGDILITKTERYVPEGVDEEKSYRGDFYRELIRQGPEELLFEPLLHYDLPDGSTMVIYRKVSTAHG